MNKDDIIMEKIKDEYQDNQLYKELDNWAFEATKDLAREIGIKVKSVNCYTHQPARYEKQKELEEYLLEKVAYFLKVNYECD